MVLQPVYDQALPFLGRQTWYFLAEFWHSDMVLDRQRREEWFLKESIYPGDAFAYQPHRLKPLSDGQHSERRFQDYSSIDVYEKMILGHGRVTNTAKG